MTSTSVENTTTTAQSILLKAPQLTHENLITVVKKIQPYRKGGIRIEHQEIKGKHVFHNYGHGSSGIGLAYGSVFNSVKSLWTYVSTDHPIMCAVIGSGLIAMLTAVQLSRNGFFVTVYADKFGKYGSTNPKQKSNNDIEEGLWLPYGYDIADNLIHEVFSKTSYDYYRDCMKTKRYQSMKMTTVYEKDATVPQLKKVIPSFVYNGYRDVNLDFGNGAQQKYTRIRTIKIDSQLFMQELRTQAYLRGIKFVQRKFNSQDQFLSLPYECFFNCSGYQSRQLFNDQKMIGSVDHLVIFKNPSKLDYTISTKLKDNMHMRVQSFGDKIILRSQTPIDQSNQQFVVKLIKQAQNFFDNRSSKAKL